MYIYCLYLDCIKKGFTNIVLFLLDKFGINNSDIPDILLVSLTLSASGIVSIKGKPCEATLLFINFILSSILFELKISPSTIGNLELSSLNSISLLSVTITIWPNSY